MDGRLFRLQEGEWMMVGPELGRGEIVERVRGIQARIRDEVREEIAAKLTESLSAVAAETAGDTIYAIDRVSEDLVPELVAEALEIRRLSLWEKGWMRWVRSFLETARRISRGIVRSSTRSTVHAG